MTITSETNRLEYAGDDVSDEFSITFKFFDAADISAALRDDATGAITAWAQPTNFSVAGGDGSTGTLTAVTAPATGETLVIWRDPPQTQETDYQPGDAFPADTHEAALDKAAQLAQANATRLDYAVRAPVADEDPLDPIPVKLLRAGYVATYDADGQPSVSTLTTEQLEEQPAEAAASAAAAAASAADAEASATAASAQLSGTSATSLAIGTGAKVFTTQAGKFFAAGMWLLITSDADPTNYMHGYVSSYAGTTLTMEITNIGGAGTFADWTIRVAGTRGATGATGDTGAAGADGADGADGKTWHNGAGAPGDGTGVDGDFYLDTTNDAYYGPKAAGTWSGTGPTSLIGPAGPGGGDMLGANNLSDVADAATSRTNLGLGTAAVQNVGAFAQVANNLSDLADAATARTNLGLAIGTNVQAQDATLAALAAYNTNGLIAQTAADTFAGRSIAGTSPIQVANGDGVAGNPTISIDAATDAAAGKVELATTTEALTGTDTDRAVTPNALAALWEKGVDVASAGTVSLGEGQFFHITGTTTITDIDWATAKDGRAAYVVFDGILTLTHNGTTLQLPGGANITTAAGDRACFIQDSSDNVICLWYTRADGTPLVSSGGDWVKLNSGSVSAAATLDIVLTSYTAYRGLKLVLVNWLPATDNAGIWLRFSTDGGSSYDAGANNYHHAYSTVDQSGTPADVGAQDTKIITGLTSGNGAADSIAAEITILGQTSMAAWTRAFWSGAAGRVATPALTSVRGAGHRRTAQDTDAIRLLFSSGNIASGTWALYGLT